MEELPVPPAPPAEVRRPKFLSALCILTFVWSGINFVASLVIGIFPEMFRDYAVKFAEQYDLPGMEMLTSVSPAFYFVNAVFYAGCVGGAWVMWNLRKIGFHVYTVSQILLLLAPMYFFRLPVPSLFEVLLTGFFVLLYSTFLKKMT